jgi:lipopolysaccharide export system protein LptC
MSDIADHARSQRQLWATPGSRHDKVIAVARVALPMAIGVLAAFLATAPLTMTGDVSFVLDKNKVAMAKERMRVTDALYRGEDGKGQPFSISARSAVQVSSKDPVVKLAGLSARILLSDGAAVMRADAGHYNIDREIVMVDGPLLFETADGYRLATRDVAVNLKTRRLASGGTVEGRMRLGTFRANHLLADLAGRTVTLDGRASLHIEQRGRRGL